MASILIKYPTRERPEIFAKTLSEWKTKLSKQHKVHFRITIEENDPSMNNPAMLAKLDKIKGLSYVVGKSINKVMAINADIMDATGNLAAAIHKDIGTPDFIIEAADDFLPQMFGYDDLIVQQFAQRFPDYNGALWFNDGLQQSKLCTLPILGWPIYQKWGFVYHPDYKSVYCDNEYTDCLSAARKLPYIDLIVIKHNWGIRDGLMARNEDKTLYDTDRDTYERRKAAGFPGSHYAADRVAPSPNEHAANVTIHNQHPFPAMSICILEQGNEPNRKSLIDFLLPDCRTMGVELISGPDIHTLIHSSMATMLAIIPEGGWSVHRNYVRQVLPMMGGYPDVVGCLVEYQPEGGKAKVDGQMVNTATTVTCEYSIQFTSPAKRQRGGLWTNWNKYPTLICPMRRDVALRALELYQDKSQLPPLMEVDPCIANDPAEVAKGKLPTPVDENLEDRWSRALKATGLVRSERYVTISSYQRLW